MIKKGKCKTWWCTEGFLKVIRNELYSLMAKKIIEILDSEIG